MILETTHTNKENIELINDLVGKPFSFLQSLRMKGIGSKRMIIDDVESEHEIISEHGFRC